MDEIIAPARHQLERIKALCLRTNLKYVDLPSQFVGVGIAIGFGEADYVILSILAGGNENQLMITDGILKNIRRDRVAALEAANHFNQNNTAYPVYLHDADAGWALIMQQTHPIDLLLDVPQYFSSCVRTLPVAVTEYRRTIAEKWDLGGHPWSWTPGDHEALLTRSML
ncbi:hypothetical protein [Symbioplanes lichenis]|uniref:hypothetical protein n=1 Tax=Symbioplanes lichenis TaxID=1629072 RepID=UPI0027387101|nr:hypothetical protein [Actinoplanes lichenis]